MTPHKRFVHIRFIVSAKKVCPRDIRAEIAAAKNIWMNSKGMLPKKSCSNGCFPGTDPDVVRDIVQAMFFRCDPR
jgi:hypothetical protein